MHVGEACVHEWGDVECVPHQPCPVFINLLGDHGLDVSRATSPFGGSGNIVINARLPLVRGLGGDIHPLPLAAHTSTQMCVYKYTNKWVVRSGMSELGGSGTICKGVSDSAKSTSQRAHITSLAHPSADAPKVLLPSLHLARGSPCLLHQLDACPTPTIEQPPSHTMTTAIHPPNQLSGRLAAHTHSSATWW